MHQNLSSTDIRKMKHSLEQRCRLGTPWGERLQTGIKLQWLEDTGQGLYLCDVRGVCSAVHVLLPHFSGLVFQRCQPRGHSGHTCLPRTTYLVIYHSSISILGFVPSGWEHWAEEPGVTSPRHLQRLKHSGSAQGSYSMSKFGLPLGGHSRKAGREAVFGDTSKYWGHKVESPCWSREAVMPCFVQQILLECLRCARHCWNGAVHKTWQVPAR